MAITASGLYVVTWIAKLNQTLAIDMSLASHKFALFDNTITPNFSTDTAYGVAPYNAHEVISTTGGTYPAGGVPLSTASAGLSTAIPGGGTLTESPTGSIKYDLNDFAVSSTTIANAYGGQLYADALAGNNAILLVNFASPVNTGGGTFTVQWAAGGIFVWDVTP